jgi:alpha-tubulin suppressor-like RCC1 family protein
MTNRHYAIAGTVVGLLILGATPAGATSPAVYEWGTINKTIGTMPKQVQSLAVVTIDAANRSDLAVLSDGTVWGWGNTEVAPASLTLVRIPGLVNVSQRPVDGNHVFAAIEQPGSDAACPTSSSVYTWGQNEYGDLGLGLSTNQVIAVPQDVTALDCKNVVGMGAGAQHMVALTSSGQVYVWGGNGPDLLGDGSVTSSTVPVLNSYATALTGGTSAGVSVTAGSSTGGMLVNGHAYSWGNNAQGECGCNSSASKIATPTAVVQGTTLFTVIDQGGNENHNGHTLALDTSGSVWAWGDGAEGQLGNGGTANSRVPVQVPGLGPMVDVRAGGMHSIALDASGNVWAWGDNEVGEVGNGSLVNQLTPLEVLSGVTMISAGSLHSLAT